jgi:hypothetical protein
MTSGTITRQQLADQQVADTKILQKVNHAHREVFLTKYPNQVEHCLRLVMERLQAGLDKRSGCDVSNPETWLMSTLELQELAQAAHLLDAIRREF